MKAEKAGHITKDKLQNFFDYLKYFTFIIKGQNSQRFEKKNTYSSSGTSKRE